MDALHASDLSHYFVSDKIISVTDHERIIRSPVPQDGAKLLLDRVSWQIQNGNTTVFNKILLIMDHYGVAAAKTLSQEIRSNLSAVKCKDTVASSSGQGTKLINFLYTLNKPLYYLKHGNYAYIHCVQKYQVYQYFNSTNISNIFL